MTIRASQFVTGQLSTITADSAGDTVVNDYFYDLPTAQNVTGDIIDLGILPAYHTVSDVIAVPDDLDTGAAMTFDVGLMSGTPGDTVSARTCGAEIFAASTAAQTGAVARPTLPSAFKILPTEADRSIGVKIAAQAATAAAGRIRLRVFMHAADHKTQF
jgi:hypothetical protein